jgi:hypothetical protein
VGLRVVDIDAVRNHGQRRKRIGTKPSARRRIARRISVPSGMLGRDACRRVNCRRRR